MKKDVVEEVLILILMEYSIWFCEENSLGYYYKYVLILILMEYSIWYAITRRLYTEDGES